jgi:sulfur-oxidizing protein SoxZ
MARAVVNVPAKAKRGEVIEVKTLAGHVCTYNGVEVYRVELHPAVAANPMINFTTIATESGTLEFRWTGDNGFSMAESATITVV